VKDVLGDIFSWTGATICQQVVIITE
jgi:hypothetical protein